jgi:hypothetical protein
MKKNHSMLAGLLISGVCVASTFAATTSTSSSCLTASSSSASESAGAATDPNKPLKISADGTVSVTVNTTAGTGYSWSLSKEDAKLGVKIIACSTPASSGQIGAASLQTITLQMPKSVIMKQSGKTTSVSLVNARPWEENSGTTTTYQVQTESHSKR